MEYFFANVDGNDNKNAAGDRERGIYAHIRTKDLGIKIVGRYDESKDEEEFYISITSGDSMKVSDLPYARITKSDLKTGRYSRKV
jgi:hypothetical protein